MTSTANEMIEWQAATIDEQAVTIAGLLEEATEREAVIDAVRVLREHAGKQHVAADLAVKRNQGAADDDWADLCATRRAWAEMVRMLDGIDGL